MYDAILIPTDGSKEMEEVIDAGLGLAEMCDATVHALHVVDDRAYSSVPDDARDTVRDTLEEDGQAATKSLAESALERGLDVEREVRWGNPPAGIVAYAAENDVDLVVMGTHGRSGYERLLLGSVAEKVVRASTVPVLTVRVDGGPEADAPQQLFEGT